MTAELNEEPAGPVNPLRDPQDRRLPRIAGPCSLVIFGVTGDLARKKLMPAVYDLANRGLLPPGFALVGFARRDYTNQDFAQIVHDSVKEHARTPFREEVWQQLAEGFRFVPGDLTDDEAFKRLRETVDELDVTRGTGGLRRDQRAERERTVRDLDVGRVRTGDLQVHALRVTALVVLPGGVQEPRSPAERHRAAGPGGQRVPE